MFAVCCITATAQTKTITHEIKRGETIEIIAKNHGISVDDIKKANPNAGDYFFVGMKIQIPVAATHNNHERSAIPTKGTTKDSTVFTNQAYNKSKENVTVTEKKRTYNDKEKEQPITRTNHSFIYLHYMQGFEEGAKGSYGLGGNITNISNSLFGVSFFMDSNLGIVKSNTSAFNFMFGPNFNYMLSERWSILVPLYIALIWQNVPVVEIKESDGYFMGEYVGKSTWENETSETHFNWGLMTTPSIVFYYKKISIGLGFALSWAKGADKLGTGFIFNLGFNIK